MKCLVIFTLFCFELFTVQAGKKMEFFLIVFTESAEFSDKKYLSLKDLEAPISCVRNQETY